MTDQKSLAYRWLPPVAGVFLIVLFVSLASWQLDRAAEKEALASLFDDTASPVTFVSVRDYELYQPVAASGRYLPGSQILIDNIVRGGQLGYYVITPFETDPGAPLLLVNRGFVRRSPAGGLPAVDVAGETRTVSGRIGRLPRVAVRPGEAIEAGQGWPKTAVYPRREDIAAVLERDVAAPVLLLAPDADDGYIRQWQPEQKGPMMHYGYAFQWSALALTVLVILIWQFRKRYRND